MAFEIKPNANEIVSTRKLRRYGSGSVAVSIPADIISGIDIEQGDDIELVHEIGSNEITIRAQPDADATDEEEDSETNGS
jgi:antitoxin component of MazEF toxin-antitoxin module